MSTRTNIIANYLGQGWVAVMGLAFVPVYVHILGVEAYGLVGVYTVLQAAITLLDLGVTPTLNREMARLRADLHTPRSIRDLLRSLELLCAGLAVAMVGVVWVGAPWLASAWLSADRVSEDQLITSLRLMGFVLAARWAEQFYRGALQGLQDMVWLNVVQAALATLRWGGAALAILYDPTVTTFFAWQGAAAVIAFFALKGRVYRILPPSAQPMRFSRHALREIRGYAGGMFFSALLAFLLIQIDKIVASRLLSLEDFGYYAFAVVGASAVQQLITPMNTALFPRFTELAAKHDQIQLASSYLRGCQWMAAVITPPALLLTFLAEPALLLWTGDAVLVREVSPLMSLLAFGTLLNGFMNLPYMLQLAHGWPSLSVRINIFAVAVIIPALLLAVPRFGAQGAAWCWVVLNATYLVVGIHLMHRRLLPSIKVQWYWTALVAPLGAGSLAALAMMSALPIAATRLSAAVNVLASTLVIATVVWSLLPATRHAATRWVKQLRRT